MTSTRKTKKPKKKISEVHLFQQIRRRHKLNQTQFAESIGFSQSHISRVEQGKKTINILMADKIMEKYKIPFSKIRPYIQAK